MVSGLKCPFGNSLFSWNWKLFTETFLFFPWLCVETAGKVSPALNLGSLNIQWLAIAPHLQEKYGFVILVPIGLSLWTKSIIILMEKGYYNCYYIRLGMMQRLYDRKGVPHRLWELYLIE